MTLSLVAYRRIASDADHFESALLWDAVFGDAADCRVGVHAEGHEARRAGRYSKSDVRCATKACVASTLVRSLVLRAAEFT